MSEDGTSRPGPEPAQRNAPTEVGAHAQTGTPPRTYGKDDRMSDRPNMTASSYEAKPTVSSGHASARIDTPEQRILENLATWARTNAWAQRIAAAKARTYHLKLEGERDRR